MTRKTDGLASDSVNGHPLIDPHHPVRTSGQTPWFWLTIYERNQILFKSDKHAGSCEDMMLFDKVGWWVGPLAGGRTGQP